MKIAGVEIVTDHPGDANAGRGRPLLFRPLKMRGVTARNRIMLGPMSQYLAIEGNLTDWHLVHLANSPSAAPASSAARRPRFEARGRRTIIAPASTRTPMCAVTAITDSESMGAVPAIQLGTPGVAGRSARVGRAAGRRRA